MKLGRKYQIERPEPGVLTHREGGIEYRFPVYDEDGEVVFVAWPTSQHIFLFFLLGGWTRIPYQFSAADCDRITSHVVEHFERAGARVRVINPVAASELDLQFHPELFEHKSTASEILEAAGFVWFADYSSIDVLHETFGLEICGIREESSVEPIARALESAFPHWHYSLCYRDCGLEPGWNFKLYMYPRCSADGCCADSD